MLELYYSWGAVMCALKGVIMGAFGCLDGTNIVGAVISSLVAWKVMGAVR